MSGTQISLPKKYLLVDEYLIRGPHPTISTLFRLRNQPCRVTQIYDFRHLSNLHFKFIERWSCKLLGIKYINVPYSNLYDPYPDLRTFEEIAHSVKQNGLSGSRTLFHCNSGQHRTAHFSAFYKLTRGEPLASVKAQLGPKYEKVVLEIVNEQVLERDYFNRTVIPYDGKNPVKGAFIKRNNIIVLALEKAHSMFMRRLGM